MMSSSSALRLLCGAFALSGCWAGWPTSRIIGSDVCARDACGAAFDAAELREGSGPSCSAGCYADDRDGTCIGLTTGFVDASCTFYEAVPESPSTQADIDTLYQACCACTFADSGKEGCALMPGFIAEGDGVTDCDDAAEAEILNGCRTTSTCSDGAAACFSGDSELECDWAAVSINEGSVCQEFGGRGWMPGTAACVDPVYPASCDVLGSSGTGNASCTIRVSLAPP